jgi:DNA-binding MarR family transcriptional regulator
MESQTRTSSSSGSGRSAETRRATTLMRRLLVGLKGRLDDELREQNVTSAQLRFLQEVKEHPGSSGAQMARAIYITPQSAQALMARAVERGWVERGTDPENHRLVTLRLTPEGERLLAYAEGVLARLSAEVWAGVSVAKLRGMNAVVERGLQNLKD